MNNSLDNYYISYGMEEIHKKLMVAFDAFHKICIDNDIHYSLHGGALLGAARNGKMIPWDDDIDVSMTQEEYNKLEAYMKTNSTNTIYLDIETMWFPRFVMKESKEVVYIDILIWNYISNNKISRSLKLNALRFVQGMMKIDTDYSRFSLKNRILLHATHGIGRLFSRKTMVRMYRRIEQHFGVGDKKNIHRSNDAFKPIEITLDQDCMKEYTFLRFEDRNAMVSVRYKDILISSYGEDYMTPPPMDQRVPQHEQFRKVLERNN